MAALLVIALPWYRSPGAAPAIWWGLPDWWVIALVGFLGIAVLNAWAWWRSEWSDKPRDDP